MKFRRNKIIQINLTFTDDFVFQNYLFFSLKNKSIYFLKVQLLETNESFNNTNFFNETFIYTI